MRKLVMLGIATFGILMGCEEVGETVKQTKELELDAESIKTLSVDTGSPEVTIKGDEFASKIEVVAVIETSEKAQDSYILNLEQNGEEAVLEANFKETMDDSLKSMNLTVTIPASLNLSVKDQAGDVKISNVSGYVNIDDQSGDIVLSKINGPLDISDQSGNIEIDEASFIVRIEDQSGDLDIKNSAGNLVVTDGSGDISVTNHEGDLDLQDQSGFLSIIDINGSVVIDDQSGDITVKNIEKDLTIKNNGSGELQVENVKGKQEM